MGERRITLRRQPASIVPGEFESDMESEYETRGYFVRRFLWRHAGSFQLTHKERVVALLDLRVQPTSESCPTDRIALQAHELDPQDGVDEK